MAITQTESPRIVPASLNMRYREDDNLGTWPKQFASPNVQVRAQTSRRSFPANDSLIHCSFICGYVGVLFLLCRSMEAEPQPAGPRGRNGLTQPGATFGALAQAPGKTPPRGPRGSRADPAGSEEPSKPLLRAGHPAARYPGPPSKPTKK